MLGVRIAKRKIEPKKPANPCGTRLCSCIFFVNALQKSIENFGFRCFFVAKTLKMVWVKMWVNCLTHTVTHTTI